MKTILEIYILVGVIVSGIMCAWAEDKGKKPSTIDFLIIMAIYPYYIYRLLKHFVD